MLIPRSCLHIANIAQIQKSLSFRMLSTLLFFLFSILGSTVASQSRHKEALRNSKQAASSSDYCYEESKYALKKKGWLFKNCTDSKVTLAWFYHDYSGRVEIIRTWKAREMIDQIIQLDPGEEIFLEKPQEKSYSRRELIISLHEGMLGSNLLNSQIESDEFRIIFNKWYHEYVKSYLYSDLDHSQFYKIVNDHGNTLQLVLGAYQASSFHNETKWYFNNKSRYPVYCRWFLVKGNGVLPIKNESIITVDSNKEKLVASPTRSYFFANRWRRYLFFSFNKSALENPINENPEILRKKIVNLEKHYSRDEETGIGLIDIIEDSSSAAPIINIEESALHITNTTNRALAIALYSKRKNCFYPHANTQCRILNPQDSCLLKWFSIAPKVSLLISQEESPGADLLMKNEKLTEEQLINNLITKKKFSKTNRTNFYLYGIYTINEDDENENSLIIESKGGGLGNIITRTLTHMAAKSVTTLRRSHGVGTAKKIVSADGDQSTPLKKMSPLQLLARNEEVHEWLCDETSSMPSILEAADKKKKLIKVSRDQLEKENNYINNRLSHNVSAVQDFLGDQQVSTAPKIAFCFTGGGYRAMISAAGFFRGADKKGLLSCTSSMYGLSGSTWLINLWLLSGLSYEDYYKVLRHSAECPLDENSSRKVAKNSFIRLLDWFSNDKNCNKSFDKLCDRRFRFNQSTGLISLYGHAIGSALTRNFKRDPADNNNSNDEPFSFQNTTFRELSKLLTPDKHPLPVNSLVCTHDTKSQHYEISPFYLGTQNNRESGYWVETLYEGCKFNDGSITRCAPETPLFTYLGCFGSAFALNKKDIKDGINSALLAYFANKAFTEIDKIKNNNTDGQVEKGRITSHRQPNFAYNYKSNTSDSCVTTRYIHPLDGGLVTNTGDRNNFAIIPALQRENDVIIMCDSNEEFDGKKPFEHLIAAAKEAKRIGQPFPKREELCRGECILVVSDEPCTLLIDDDDDCPIVIYIRYMKYGENDPAEWKFTNTMNFSYTVDEFDKLAGLCNDIISDEETQEKIKAAIKYKTQHTKKSAPAAISDDNCA